ncbi:hypothetical protein F5887DRAFT_965138 [Amanita rubescens]|nr:hypothetical protein F5887DRAFT_965138 [Amanita rubescens]
MRELIGELAHLVHPSSEFEQEWKRKGSKHVTGKPGYRSYEYVGGYGVGNIVTPAIIKGIWITGVTTGIKEEEIIHEGAYLWKEGMLFAFLINDRPSRDLPDYIFIIKNVGSDLVSEAQTRLTKEGAKRFRDTTKAELMSDYNPKPKFLPRESWMYSKKNGMKAVFV